jgi:hypothetical protein
MKLLIDPHPSTAAEPFANSFSLPDGLIGLADFKHAELVSSAEQFPFSGCACVAPKGRSTLS